MQHHSYIRKFLALLLITSVFSGFLGTTHKAYGTTYTFTQSGWTGGQSALTATHPTHQSGWTKFSTSTAIAVNPDGSISLPQVDYSATDGSTLSASGTATGGGFGNGSQSNTGVSGSAITLSVSSPNPAWTRMSNTPATITTGGVVAYGGGDYIYGFMGGTTNFYKYSIANNTWTGVQSPTSGATVGAMAYPGSGDHVYWLQTNGIFKYSISGDSWVKAANAPATIGGGVALVYPGSGDYLYAFAGGLTTSFYRFSISGNTWTSMTSAPGAISNGGALVYPGGGDYLYAYAGGATTSFYRYSISGNSWTSMAAAPNNISYGAGLAYPDSGDYIYGTQGNSSNLFYKYSISGNAWTTISGTLGSGTSNNGGALTAAQGNIYALQGAGSNGFFKYVPADDGTGWAAKQSMLANAGSGGAMAYDGSGYVYQLAGGATASFYRYSISGNAWSSMAVTPATIGAGGALAYPGSGDYLYALRGNTTASFYRYSISGNSWTSMASLPANVAAGGALVSTGGDYIYAFAGGNATSFYRYSISGNSWTTLAVTPSAIASGASLAYPGYGDYMYALKGNSATVFRYSISGDTWTTLSASLPASNGLGATLVSTGDDYLYSLRGNGSNDFYRYSISGNVWASMPYTPASSSGMGFGSSMSFAQGKLYALQGGSANLFAYSLPYASSGTFTSAVIDLGGVSSLSTLAYTATTPSGTAVTFDIRAGNTATPDGSWTGWQTGIASGGSIAELSGNRYVQYRATLSTSNTANTPTINSVTIGYTQYALSGNLISSAFDTTDAANVIGSFLWYENATLPSGTGVTVSLRSAATSDGLTAASWADFTNATSQCTKTDQAIACPIAAIPAALKDGAEDEWIQYKVTLASNGVSTPTVSHVGFQYVVNTPPEFDMTYGTNGVLIQQVSNASYSNYGKVTIDYKIRDADGNTGTITPLKVTPTFEYNTGSGWLEIPSQYLGADDLNEKTIRTTDYSIHTAVWDIQSHLPHQYIDSVQVRVTIDDGEAANNTATAASSVISADTKDPVVGTYQLDVGAGTLSLGITDHTAVQYVLSNDSDVSSDGSNDSSGSWQIGSTTVSESIGWNFSGANPTVYLVAKDAYGNTVATSTAIAPATPANFDLKDTSNTNSGDYRIFLSWAIASSVEGAQFQKYEVYRSTNGGSTYSLRSTVTDANTNYYTDTGLSSGTTYYYKIRVIDTDGDASDYSTTVSDIPDGQGGTDFTAPTISAVTVASTQTTWAKVTWTTDELSTSHVDYSVAGSTTTAQYGSSVSSDSYVIHHEVMLTGLQPDTQYVFRVKSTDIYNNNATDDDDGSGWVFATAEGTSISDVAVEYVSDSQATIVWNTPTDSNSLVEYSTDADGLTSGESISEAGSSDLVGAQTASGWYQHRVMLTGLEPRTNYYFYVKSTDENGNTAIDKNGGSYYRFFTTYDTKAPVISNITKPVITSNSVVVVWTTDELSDSKIAYGTESGDLNSQTETNSTMTISHVMTITELAADTKYYFKAISNDAQDNEGESAEQEVTTSSSGTTQIVYVPVGGSSGGSSKEDTTAPTISQLTASSTGPFSAKISFSTDESSTAFVSYNPEGGQVRIEGNPTFATKHVINVSGLRMGSEYRYRVKVQDKAGNFGQSDEGAFKTPFVAESMDNLVTLKNAADFQDQLENLIESALPSLSPPFIAQVEVGSTTESSATVYWKTNTPTYGSVLYVNEDEYDASKEKPYAQEAAQTDEKRTSHSLELTNLSPATRYHFQVRAYSLPGVIGTSKDMTFATKASRIRPEVANIGNTEFEIRWTTPKKTSSIVEYRDTVTGKIRRVEDGQQAFTHIVKVENLDPNRAYSVRAYGYDSATTLVEGESLTVRTNRDVKAPTISSVQIDNALLPGRTDRLQTVVSWKTDEPSDGKVLYEEGVGGATALSQNVRQDIFATEHILIIPSLKPSTIYRIKIESKDMAGNVGSTTVKTILTPHSAENIIDVIVKNLQESFGFLNNIR